MYARRRSVGVLVAALAGVTFAVSVAAASGPTGAARKPTDLVWISDSAGWGVAPFYAREIRKSLGVEVRVHDMWEGDLPAAVVLSRLRTTGHDWIPLIRNAEVIFVSGNSAGLAKHEGGNCISNVPEPPGEPQAREWAGYVAGLRAIYKRIFAIRKGEPVILRTGNWYAAAIAQAPASPFFKPISWEQAGLVDECTKEWEAFAGAIAKAAGSYRIPVADVYTAFNGADHREDPVAKGYIQPDGIHPSNKGRAIIAKTVAALGFEKVRQPR